MSTRKKLLILGLGVIIGIVVTYRIIASKSTETIPVSVAGTELPVSSARPVDVPVEPEIGTRTSSENREQELDLPAERIGRAPTPVDTIDNSAADEDSLSEIQFVLDELFRAASVGDKGIAETVSVAGNSVAADVLELNRVFDEAGELVVDIYANATKAIAISDSVTLQDGANELEGYLVFSLVRSEANWLVNDIDFESYDGGIGELDEFLANNPEAVQLNP